MCCKHATAVRLCVRSSLPSRVSVVLVVVEIVVVIVNSISKSNSSERHTNERAYALTYTQGKHKRSHNNNNKCIYIYTACLFTHIVSLYLFGLVVNRAAQRARKCTHGLHSNYHNKHGLLSLSLYSLLQHHGAEISAV
jgi:hypothetical protein